MSYRFATSFDGLAIVEFGVKKLLNLFCLSLSLPFFPLAEPIILGVNLKLWSTFILFAYEPDAESSRLPLTDESSLAGVPRFAAYRRSSSEPPEGAVAFAGAGVELGTKTCGGPAPGGLNYAAHKLLDEDDELV